MFFLSLSKNKKKIKKNKANLYKANTGIKAGCI